MRLWRSFPIVVLLTNSAVLIAEPGIAEPEAMPKRFAPCPASPNCVSSDDPDPSHRVAVFDLAVPAADAWRVALEVVKGLPRTAVVEATDNYLRAECASAIFQFVDDLELELRPGEVIIAVRSASRTGRSDFGVNRRRVERLRDALRDRGVVK